MKNKILNFINSIALRLKSVIPDIVEAKQEAWWMLEEIIKKSEAELLLKDEIELSKEEEEQLNLWLYQRVQEKKPLQYILGYVPFCDLMIKTKPPVLIPRPETEEWASWLIELIRKDHNSNKKLQVLDLCSGSGCIALALAKDIPNSYVIGVDILNEAIELSLENKKFNKIENADFVKSDLFENIKDKSNFFDLIISNPPYLSAEEFDHLSEEVRAWESKKALVADHEGYAFYENIIKQAPKFLSIKPSELKIPQVVLEIGYKQASHVCEIFKSHNYSNIQVHKDMEGKDRWVSANYTYMF